MCSLIGAALVLAHIIDPPQGTLLFVGGIFTLVGFVGWFVGIIPEEIPQEGEER